MTVATSEAFLGKMIQDGFKAAHEVLQYSFKCVSCVSRARRFTIVEDYRRTYLLLADVGNLQRGGDFDASS